MFRNGHLFLYKGAVVQTTKPNDQPPKEWPAVKEALKEGALQGLPLDALTAGRPQAFKQQSKNERSSAAHGLGKAGNARH